jgi:hypothetical protein
VPVYKKKVSTHNPRFQGKQTVIASAREVTVIPIPDEEVICNSCNGNIYSEECKYKSECDVAKRVPCFINSNKVCLKYEPKETFGWLIYFDKRDVKADRPYDFYCDQCTTRNFPKAIEV